MLICLLCFTSFWAKDKVYSLSNSAALYELLFELIESIFNLELRNVIVVVMAFHKHARLVFTGANSQVATTMNLISNATSII